MSPPGSDRPGFGEGTGVDLEAGQPPTVPEVVAEPACDGAEGKPEELCIGSECLPLSCPLRRAVVTWLAPHDLPAVGDELVAWRDRSGLGNNAMKSGSARTSFPIVREPRPGIDPALERAVALDETFLFFAPPRVPSLSFGRKDFLVLVSASLLPRPVEAALHTQLFSWSHPFTYLTLMLTPEGQLMVESYYNGADGRLVAPAVRLLSREFGLNDSCTRLYGVRRKGEHIELRLEGAARGSTDLLPEANLGPGLVDGEIVRPVFLSPTVGTEFAGDRFQHRSTALARVSAVVVLEGEVPDAQVAEVEDLLFRRLSNCPRLDPPRSEAPVDPPLEAGSDAGARQAAASR